MLGAAPVIPFVPSLDLTRSCAFYADVLGLSLEEVRDLLECVWPAALGVRGSRDPL
jgi:hypothetical protein